MPGQHVTSCTVAQELLHALSLKKSLLQTVLMQAASCSKIIDKSPMLYTYFYTNCIRVLNVML